MLAGAMLLTFGCTDEGPGVSPDSKPGAASESFADKRPKEVQDGTAKKTRKAVGTNSVKGLVPGGTQ
jgi:hypothetical protein